jgi:predicted TIM-barrel fold metal-dependent hydrolase
MNTERNRMPVKENNLFLMESQLDTAHCDGQTERSRSLNMNQKTATGRHNISRREFGSKLLKTGIGLAAASVLPSFKNFAEGEIIAEKFIDVHHHLGGDLMINEADFSFDPIIAWMDKNEVSQTILLSPIQHPETYYPSRTGNIICNDAILDRFAETNGRLLPFCVVHPDAYTTTKEIVRVLKRYKKKGVIGFGELKPRDTLGESRNMALDDTKMERIYAACAEVDFPVLLHIDNKHAVDVPGLPTMERVLKNFPDVNFIGHANGWWNSITGDVKEFKGYPKGKVTTGGAAVRLLEKYPNMYADLSANSGLNAITRDPDFGKKFLIDFSDKLLFGTDAIGGTGRESHFDFYNKIDLPQEVKNKIFRENTRNLLKV